MRTYLHFVQHLNLHHTSVLCGLRGVCVQCKTYVAPFTLHYTYVHTYVHMCSSLPAVGVAVGVTCCLLSQYKQPRLNLHFTWNSKGFFYYQLDRRAENFARIGKTFILSTTYVLVKYLVAPQSSSFTSPTRPWLLRCHSRHLLTTHLGF